MSEPLRDPCELLANASAWVLGALGDNEVGDYAVHVDGCTHCQAEIARLNMVRDALGQATVQVSPPPQLGDRIMAIVSSEAELLRAAGPQADRPAQRAATSRPRRSWLSGWRLVPVGAAVLALGLVVGVALEGSGSSTGSAQTTEASVTAPGAHAQLVVDGTRASLHMTGMPNPPAGKVYEVWVQHGSSAHPAPTDALFTVRSSGAGDVTVPTAVHAGDHVLVTAERSGGSNVPTSAPVISAQA